MHYDFINTELDHTLLKAALRNAFGIGDLIGDLIGDIKCDGSNIFPVTIKGLVVIYDEPSVLPSLLPSNEPSLLPTDEPSLMPSDEPSLLPSDLPTLMPSGEPSEFPSDQPSHVPSTFPSFLPSLIPSMSSAPSGGSIVEYHSILFAFRVSQSNPEL